MSPKSTKKRKTINDRANLYLHIPRVAKIMKNYLPRDVRVSRRSMVAMAGAAQFVIEELMLSMNSQSSDAMILTTKKLNRIITPDNADLYHMLSPFIFVHLVQKKKAARERGRQKKK